MNNLPGIGDPYWYEWFVGVKNVIKMLNPDNGIEYVIFQSSSYESIDDVVVGKIDIVKNYIELLYGKNGENLFSMTDIEGIHNNFRKYLHIVDRDLEIEVDEKLKWNVARYMDYKEYALYPVLKEFNNIADIDAKSWKREGIELYKLCCTARELGSSLYEEEVQLDIMKQATNLGIKDLWESISLDFTMTERLEDIYSLILHLLNIYNDEENLKNLWILSVGILSFYNKEDQK